MEKKKKKKIEKNNFSASNIGSVTCNPALHLQNRENSG